jgi:hypothetical protein
MWVSKIRRVVSVGTSFTNNPYFFSNLKRFEIRFCYTMLLISCCCSQSSVTTYPYCICSLILSINSLWNGLFGFDNVSHNFILQELKPCARWSAKETSCNLCTAANRKRYILLICNNPCNVCLNHETVSSHHQTDQRRVSKLVLQNYTHSRSLVLFKCDWLTKLPIQAPPFCYLAYKNPNNKSQLISIST